MAYLNDYIINMGSSKCTEKASAEVQTEMYTFTVYSCQTIQCPVEELTEQMGRTSPVT